MNRTARPHERVVIACVVCFSVGVLVGWSLHGKAPSPVVPVASNQGGTETTKLQLPVATTGEPAGAVPPAIPLGTALEELRRRPLRLPIDGASVDSMKGGFAEKRGGRAHEAVDFLAPRNTPVHAVQDGTIAKLFVSKAGGNTIYQFDPSGRFCYYYAHLERYAGGLREGQHVSQRDVLGFVGTSGNAPPGTPHLHFAVLELGEDGHWWQGRPIDPYLIFRQ